jgi:hypothetical protein
MLNTVRARPPLTVVVRAFRYVKQGSAWKALANLREQPTAIILCCGVIIEDQQTHVRLSERFTGLEFFNAVLHQLSGRLGHLANAGRQGRIT